ncbi:hypothetical protein JCM8547_005660 [Rhodosporidiobolus lusitaniae]
MSKKDPLDEKPPPSATEPFHMHVVRSSLPSSSFGSSSSSASSERRLLDKMGFLQPTLSVEVEQDIVWLLPEPDPSTRREDAHLNGSVTLYLPKPRKLKRLDVRMAVRYNLQWPHDSPRHGAYENGVLEEKVVSLLEEGEKEIELETGSHTFHFLFFLGQNSATWERSLYGAIRHSVMASAKLSPTSSFLPATLLESEPQRFYAIASNSPEGGAAPPPPLSQHTEGHFPGLGPWALELQMQHSTVANLLLFRLILPAPATTVHLLSIKVTILQTSFLTSPHPNSPSEPFETQPESFVVCVLNAEYPPNDARMRDNGRGAPRRRVTKDTLPFRSLEAGEGAQIAHLARLENDNVLRPSARPATETPNRTEHKIEVEVVYREGRVEDDGKKDAKGKGKEELPELQRLRVLKPLELHTCLTFLDSLELPTYTADDPLPVLSTGIDRKIPCVCGLTLNELLEKHANTLLTSLRADTAAPAITCPCFVPSTSSAQPSHPSHPSPKPSTEPSPTPSPSLFDSLHSDQVHLKPPEQRAALSPAPTAVWYGERVGASQESLIEASSSGGVAEEERGWKWREEAVP